MTSNYCGVEAVVPYEYYKLLTQEAHLQVLNAAAATAVPDGGQEERTEEPATTTTSAAEEEETTTISEDDTTTSGVSKLFIVLVSVLSC